MRLGVTAGLNPAPTYLNEHGELIGVGPSWACETYGTAGHDYFTCPICGINYQHWLSVQAVTT
jgi:hypothetical protein